MKNKIKLIGMFIVISIISTGCGMFDEEIDVTGWKEKLHQTIDEATTQLENTDLEKIGNELNEKGTSKETLGFFERLGQTLGHQIKEWGKSGNTLDLYGIK